MRDSVIIPSYVGALLFRVQLGLVFVGFRLQVKRCKATGEHQEHSQGGNTGKQQQPASVGRHVPHSFEVVLMKGCNLNM